MLKSPRDILQPEVNDLQSDKELEEKPTFSSVQISLHCYVIPNVVISKALKR
jgi:hypothetical protein